MSYLTVSVCLIQPSLTSTSTSSLFPTISRAILQKKLRKQSLGSNPCLQQKNIFHYYSWYTTVWLARLIGNSQLEFLLRALLFWAIRQNCLLTIRMVRDSTNSFFPDNADISTDIFRKVFTLQSFDFYHKGPVLEKRTKSLLEDQWRLQWSSNSQRLRVPLRLRGCGC